MNKYTVCLVPLLFFNGIVASENLSISTRIVGGEESYQDDWPWMVSVHAGGYVCGGTLINTKVVLTAAHCLFDNNYDPIPIDEINVTIGEYDKNSTPSTVAKNIIKKHIHEEYTPYEAASLSDIALLHLDNAIDTITPLDMLDLDSTNEAISLGSYVTAIGWGSTVGYESGEEVTPTYPSILRDVELPLQQDANCLESLGTSYDASSMLCAGFEEGGASSCQGDSGGPLVYNDSGTWKQIGIVSWGVGCATAGYPGVYTRLAAFSDWVESRINNVFVDEQLIFPYMQINSTSTQTLTLYNNTISEAQLSYTLTGSENFSYETSECNSIAPKESCNLNITYSSSIGQISQATLSITNNLSEASTLTTLVEATTVSDISDIAIQANFSNENIQWFTGGDAKWSLLDGTEILQSTTISDLEESILLATVIGTGLLSFEWAVDSEVDFDYLNLFINDQLIASISGKQDFSVYSYFLSEESNTVVWQYKKDTYVSSGSDKASLTKVTFEPMYEPESEEEKVLQITKSSGGGGGSGSLLLLIAFPLLLLRCRCFKK
jgi:secreted trypsin-like serine protease